MKLLKMIDQSLFTRIYRTFTVQTASSGLSFLLQIAIARTLELDVYGLYILALSWMRIGSVIVKFGFQTTTLRYIPYWLNQKEYNRSYKFLILSIKTITALSMLIIVVALANILLNRPFEENSKILIISIFLFALPFYSFLEVINSWFQIYKNALLSLIPRTVIIPTIFILTIHAYNFYLPITPINMAVIYVVVVFLVSLSMLATLLKKYILPQFESDKDSTSLDRRKIFKVGSYLAFVGSFHFIYKEVSVLTLGFLSDSESIAKYGVALKIGLLFSVGLTTITFILAPQISKLYRLNKLDILQKKLNQTSVYLFLMALGILIFVFLFGKYFLSMFGSEFVASYQVLIILAIGESISMITGPVGILLSTTEYEKELMKITISSMLLNVILNFALIPPLGIVGAAIGTSTAVVYRNSYMTYIVKKKLNLKTNILF